MAHAMEKSADKKDTFIVVERRDNASPRHEAERFRSAILPSGQKVHAIDREVFERAVKAAMAPSAPKK